MEKETTRLIFEQDLMATSAESNKPQEENLLRGDISHHLVEILQIELLDSMLMDLEILLLLWEIDLIIQFPPFSYKLTEKFL